MLSFYVFQCLLFFFFKKGNGLPFPFYPSYFIFLLFSLPSLHFSSQNVGSVLAVPYTLFEICIHSIIVMIGRKVFHQLCCTFRLNQMKGICEELNQIEPNERYIWRTHHRPVRELVNDVGKPDKSFERISTYNIIIHQNKFQLNQSTLKQK